MQDTREAVRAGKKLISVFNMKTIFVIVIAAFLTAGTTLAQRTFFINANVSELNMSFTDGTSINLNGNGGWFLADNFALVGGIGLHSYSNEGYSTSTFGLNAGGRFYFAGDFFAEGLVNLSKAKDMRGRTGLTLGVGYAYFLNDYVALEPKFNAVVPIAPDEGGSTRFGISCGISVYF